MREKSKIPIENWAKKHEHTIHKKWNKMALRHMKKCSTSLIIRERQSVSTPKYYFHPSDWPKLKNLATHYIGESVEKLAFLYIVVGNQNVKTLWGWYGISEQNRMYV